MHGNGNGNSRATTTMTTSPLSSPTNKTTSNTAVGEPSRLTRFIRSWRPSVASSLVAPTSSTTSNIATTNTSTDTASTSVTASVGSDSASVTACTDYIANTSASASTSTSTQPTEMGSRKRGRPWNEQGDLTSTGMVTTPRNMNEDEDDDGEDMGTKVSPSVSIEAVATATAIERTTKEVEIQTSFHESSSVCYHIAFHSSKACWEKHDNSAWQCQMDYTTIPKRTCSPLKGDDNDDHDDNMEQSSSSSSSSAAAAASSSVIPKNKIDVVLQLSSGSRRTCRELAMLATIPKEGTLPHFIYQQHQLSCPTVGTSTLGATRRSLPINNNMDDIDSNLLVFFRWIQARLALGWHRSCLTQLHRTLQEGYHEAATTACQQVETPGPNAAEASENTVFVTVLLPLRHRLAGLWCIYAQVIWDVGLKAYQKRKQLLLLQQQQQKQPHEIENPASTGSTNQRACRSTQRRTANVANLTTWAENTAAQGVDLELDNVLNHVIAILETARNCPLVGNHKHIVLALGRMSVVGSILKHEDGGERSGIIPGLYPTTVLDSESLGTAIADAMSSCRDAMEICHGNLPSLKKNESSSSSSITSPHAQKAAASIDFLSHYYDSPAMTVQGSGRARSASQAILNNSMTMARAVIPKEAPVSSPVLETELKAILELPSEWRDSMGFYSSTTVVADLNAARALCLEINRWSRLKEKLEQRLCTVLAPNRNGSSCSSFCNLSTSGHPAAATPWLEHFVLYRCMDCPSDVPHPNGQWKDVEYASAIPGHVEPRVEWKW